MHHSEQEEQGGTNGLGPVGGRHLMEDTPAALGRAPTTTLQSTALHRGTPRLTGMFLYNTGFNQELQGDSCVVRVNGKTLVLFAPIHRTYVWDAPCWSSLSKMGLPPTLGCVQLDGGRYII